MLNILLPMAILLLAGTLWRPLKPMGLDADTTRKALTGLVYVLLLPALVLDVLWKAPLGIDSFKIVLMAAVGVVTGVALASIIYRKGQMNSPARGAMILAASWANVTYLGLPVLEQTFGSEYRSVALQYDLFSNTPLLLTLGIWIAQRHGSGPNNSTIVEIFSVPALWAAIAAIALNLYQVPVPTGLGTVLNMLGTAVPPLMLLALGMGLRWDILRWNRLPLLLPAIIIQLMAVPLMVYLMSQTIGLSGDLQVAVILEAAMPTMVLGMVICDRYKLDSALFAGATTLSTGLALFTLPMWYSWVS